jgi:hypothetical protein
MCEYPCNAAVHSKPEAVQKEYQRGVNDALNRVVLSKPMLQTSGELAYRERLIKSIELLITPPDTPDRSL